MAGLLSSGSALTGLLAPIVAQATVGARQGMIPAAQARPTPAPVQEHRVNPLRVALSTLISGTNPFDAYDQERLRPQREASVRNRLQVEQGLLSMFGPQTGAPATAGGLPQAGGAAPRNGLPSLRDVGPQLAAAQVLGIEGIGGLVNLLKETSPDIDVVNGVGYDRNDAGNVGRRIGTNLANNGQFAYDPNDSENANRFFPDVPEGAEPVYDRQGNVIGVRAVSGAIDYLGARQRATSDANNASQASYASAISGGQAAGQAPYQVETVVGPDGAPVTMSRATLLGGGGNVGQTPAQAVVAEGNARNQVGALEDARVRSAAANRILPQLDKMEDLLADINSGFGANARTGLDRVAASLPLGPFNDDAQRRASATQTFQNEARQVVSGILPLFGANPTEGERKYAEAMSGADVTYTPEALAEGIRLARDRARRSQQTYDQLRNQTNGQNQGSVTPDQARAILRARGVPGY